VLSTPELIERLGEFSNAPETFLKPITSIECITDWDPLYGRYKPENICKSFQLHFLEYLKKAVSVIEEFDRKWEGPEWKVSIDDKKDQL